jgi:hypothetical protein
MLSNRFSNSNSGSSSSRNRNSNSNSMNRGSSSNNSSGKSNNNAGLASEGGSCTGTVADQGLGCDSARVASSTAERYLLECVCVLIFVWASLVPSH